MKCRSFSHALFTGVMAFAMACGVAPEEVEADGTTTITRFEWQVFQETNRARTENGLTALGLQTGCMRVAREQAHDMRRCNYFDHERSACNQRRNGPVSGESFRERIARI